MTWRTKDDGFTTDRSDPRLGHGVDDGPTDQHKVYLILSAEERAKGFVRPLRRAYIHTTCGALTTMALPLCETYARQPNFYSSTFCCKCRAHLAVGEFVWDEDGEVVGS